MSVTVSDPIGLREPGTGHLRVISAPGDDRVVILLRAVTGMHSIELTQQASRRLRLALPSPARKGRR